MVDLMVGGGKTVMAALQFGFDDQTVADAEEKQWCWDFRKTKRREGEEVGIVMCGVIERSGRE